MRRSSNTVSISGKSNILKVLNSIKMYDAAEHTPEYQSASMELRNAEASLIEFKRTNKEYRRLEKAFDQADKKRDRVEAKQKDLFYSEKEKLNMTLGVEGATPENIEKVKAFIKKWKGIDL